MVRNLLKGQMEIIEKGGLKVSPISSNNKKLWLHACIHIHTRTDTYAPEHCYCQPDLSKFISNMYKHGEVVGHYFCLTWAFLSPPNQSS